MIEHGETSKVRLPNRLIRRRGVIIVSFCVVLAATSAVAQQHVGTAAETVTTRHARTDDEERVVIETYIPSIEAGRLALSRRINRVTTATDDGSQTVEETAERNPASPGESLRVAQRSVTTVRRSGTDSYVSQRQIFERDANGRLVLVGTQTEHTSRN